MSKSKGNIVDPLELLEKYPSDLLRAYFVAKINFLHDGVCDESLLKNFYHSFLVNDLGNLVARVKKMIQLYNQEIIPKFIESTNNEELNDYYKFCSSSYNKFNSFMNDYELTKGFQQIQELIKKSNKLIDNLTP
jgi:methionyl-tRNA synthetase